MSDLRRGTNKSLGTSRSDFKGGGLGVSEIASLIGMSPSHTRRMAVAGVIPERFKSKGGHYTFRNTPALKRWIARMQPERPERMRVLATFHSPERVKAWKGVAKSERAIPVAQFYRTVMRASRLLREMLKEEPLSNCDKETLKFLDNELSFFADVRGWVREELKPTSPPPVQNSASRPSGRHAR